jgi:predicted nucleic acid-binding protein
MHDWFAEHRQSLYNFVPVSEPIIQQACQLIVRHPLRSYDALHLITALFVNQELLQAGATPLVFLSADNRLNGAAQIEGLSVDNPNDHP